MDPRAGQAGHPQSGSCVPGGPVARRREAALCKAFEAWTLEVRSRELGQGSLSPQNPRLAVRETTVSSTNVTK